MDTASVKHSAITINGIVQSIPGVSSRLWGNSITINSGGALVIGSAGIPHTALFEVVLDGARPTITGNSGGGALVTGLTHTGNVSTGNNGGTNDNFGINRGLIVNAGGKLNLVGSPRAYTRTRLNANWTAGTSITVADPVTVLAGETIYVSPTNIYNAANRTEALTVAANCISSTTIVLTAAPTYPRWGQLQYATDAGISLTNGAWTTGGMKPNAAMDNVVDQRAYVMIPSRNVVVRAATDAETGTAAIATYGFGFHIMAMDSAALSTEVYVDGVQFQNFGQRGLLGRYGIHWHLTNWNTTTGAFRGLYGANQAVVKRCAFDFGHNRAVDFHASAGVVASNNDAYRSFGHAYFLEDGSEQQNTLSSNWALRTTDPGTGNRLKGHDIKASGFWFSNLYNTFSDNHGIDSDGFGWWNTASPGLIGVQASPQYGCVGASVGIPVAPRYAQPGTWDGNTAMCNGVGGGNSADSPTDNEGTNLSQYRMQTTTDGIAGADYGNPKQVATQITNARLYQHPDFAYVNNVSNPLYSGWKVSDNMVRGLAGSTDTGICQQILISGRSLNTLDSATSSFTNGFASYHGSLFFSDVSAYNFPYKTPIANPLQDSSLMGTALMESWDLYLHALEMWTNGAMTNWKLYNTVGMFQTPPGNLMSQANYAPYLSVANQTAYNVSTGDKRYWSLAAVWDKSGFLTGTPNAWSIFDCPFLTYGVTSTPQGTLGLSMQKVVTGTEFFGLTPMENDLGPSGAGGSNFFAAAAIEYQLCDTSFNDIAGAVWSIHSIPAAGYQRLRFRNGMIRRGGILRYHDPELNTINAVKCKFLVTNCYRLAALNGVDDWFILGIPWVATGTISVSDWASTDSYPHTGVPYTAVASKAALLAATSRTYYRDTAAQMVWVRFGYLPYGIDNTLVENQSTARKIELTITP